MKIAQDTATAARNQELVLRDLAVQRWPIDKLIPYARNARTHSDEQVAQVAASIVEFGWTNPILVGADGVIIAGHARLAAARKLKFNRSAGHRPGSSDANAAPGPGARRQPTGTQRRMGRGDAARGVGVARGRWL